MKTTKYFRTFANVLSENERTMCAEYLRRAAWSFDNTSRSAPQRGVLCWSMWGLEKIEFFSKGFMTRIAALLEMHVDVERIYANGQTYGQDGAFHLDGPKEDDRRITFLYYPVLLESTAVYEFGGETQFIQDDGSLHAVSPFTNSGVAFSSNISHRGLGPSRFSKDLRISVAFKLIRH